MDVAIKPFFLVAARAVNSGGGNQKVPSKETTVTTDGGCGSLFSHQPSWDSVY